MYEYEILESNENDYQATLIKKSGITTEFTLKQVYDHKLKLEQDVKEKESAVELAKAKMQNIENNHPEIKKIVDKIHKGENAQGVLATLFLWIQADIDRDNNERMVKERLDAIQEYENELDDIHERLSIPKPVKIAYAKGTN